MIYGRISTIAKRLVPAPQSLTKKQLRERQRTDDEISALRARRVEEMRERLLTICLPMMRQSRIASRYVGSDRRTDALRAARMGLLMAEDCTVFRPMIVETDTEQETP